MDFADWQKRVGVISTLSIFVLLTFVARLYQKTVIEYKETVHAAESQYTFRKEIDGQRGNIVVKENGNNYYPLATNERKYQVIAIPNHIRDAKDTADKLAPILGTPEQEIFDKINNKKYYIPPLKRRLDRTQADRIAELKLEGIVLLPELVRTYPEQSLASQLIGFVNNDGKGNYGIEGTFDDVLRGESGYQVGEKDNQGRLITVSDEVKPKQGATIVLTLNREIQFIVEKYLAEAVKDYQADSGTIVVMQPKTGSITAMASLPNFNPNEFNKVPTEEQSRFINSAIANVWEPGSVMKPILMALALDKKLVEPDTKETFGASIRVLNHDIYTAEKKAFGTETMTQILENSDNVGMVWVSNKLGNQTEYEGLKRFGFGEVPKLNLRNTTTGSVPELKQWNDLTRATISFGQGISITPLQMAMAYSVLANKGVMMQPYIVAEVIDDKGILTTTTPSEVGRVISEDASNKIGLMLESVVINGHGKRAQIAGYRIGGKTGTAQVPKPEGGYFDDRHIGSFAGYFPISDPEYAMVVVLQNPKTVEFAESSAAPTFGKIAAWILHSQQIKSDKPQ